MPVAHADILPTIWIGSAWRRRRVSTESADRSARRGSDGLFEALEANLTRGWAPLTGVSSPRWKYIELPVASSTIARDPGETDNLGGA